MHRIADSAEQRMTYYDSSLWENLIEERYAQREEKRLETLRDVREKIYRYFIDKSVARVYIFGSILKEGAFYDFSDIDIAVEGLDKNYFRVCAEVEDIVGRNIEIVELEKCRFRESVERYGIRIL